MALIGEQACDTIGIRCCGGMLIKRMQVQAIALLKSQPRGLFRVWRWRAGVQGLLYWNGIDHTRVPGSWGQGVPGHLNEGRPLVGEGGAAPKLNTVASSLARCSLRDPSL